MDKNAIVVTQSASPYFAREPFWTINQTMGDVFSYVAPYTSYVPSFGQWGFNMGSNIDLEVTEPTFVRNLRFPEGLKFLTPYIAPTLFVFDPDMSRVTVETNRID